MVDLSMVGAAIAAFVAWWLFTVFLHRKKVASNSSSGLREKSVESSAAGAYEDLPVSEDARTEVIIVGAGVAGAALACTLAKDGRRVRVFDRDLTEQDRIVGEVLQPGGYLKLVELGLEDCVKDIDAQHMVGLAFYKDRTTTKLSYPLESYGSDFVGRSFHNGRFVQRMRDKAASLPNVKMEEGTVTSLVEEKGAVIGLRYKTKTGQELTAYAPLTVVCDGCFSNLRRNLCKTKINVPSHFVAVILDKCELPFRNHGHVILGDPSIIVFYRISSTEVRCMVDVPGEKAPSISNNETTHYLKTVVAPQVPTELYDAFLSAVDKGNLRTMPNRSMPADDHQPTPGAILLGDAFNMRHPLTGGGMTVALYDIVVLRELLKPIRNLNDSYILRNYLESFYTLRKPVASTINTFADAIYKIFCASPDKARQELRQATFDYLSLSEGPITLISGLNPRPWILVFHLFVISIYGVGRLLLPFPSPKRVLLGAKLVYVALGILIPSIKAEGARQMFFPTTIPAYDRAHCVNEDYKRKMQK